MLYNFITQQKSKYNRNVHREEKSTTKEFLTVITDVR